MVSFVPVILGVLLYSQGGDAEESEADETGSRFYIQQHVDSLQ